MSIYGETFSDENFLLRHTGAGLLSMVRPSVLADPSLIVEMQANSGTNSNGCQVNICFVVAVFVFLIIDDLLVLHYMRAM